MYVVKTHVRKLICLKCIKLGVRENGMKQDMLVRYHFVVCERGPVVFHDSKSYTKNNHTLVSHYASTSVPV
jgi:hypothetical protein